MRVIWLCDQDSPHIKRWKSAIEMHDVEVLTVSLPKLRPRFRYAFAIASIDRRVRSFAPDIIHAHFASSYGVVSTFINWPCPKVTSVWGSDVLTSPTQGSIYNLFLKRSLSHPDYVVTNSEFLKKCASELVPRDYLHIPFGVDVSEFQTASRKRLGTSAIRLGIVKRLHPVAGVDLAIKALSILHKKYPDKNYFLTIVGEGPERAKLEMLIRELELESHTEMLGELNKHDVAKVYQTFDIAIFPSRVEGLGVSIIEAMMSEVPVVAHNIGGIQELLVNGQHGWPLKSNSPIEVASQIHSVIENYSHAKTLALRAQKFVMDKYDLKNNIQVLVSLYEQIVLI